MFKVYSVDPEQIRCKAVKLNNLACEYQCTCQTMNNKILEILNDDLYKIIDDLDKFSEIDNFKGLTEQYNSIVQQNMCVFENVNNSICRLNETMRLIEDYTYQLADKIERINEILGLCDAQYSE